MSKEELKKSLLESLRSQLNLEGFTLNKATAEFTKQQSDGWNKFQLIFLDRSAGWEINIGLLIRKDVIENIYHQASLFESKYRKTTPSLGIAAEKLINDDKEYRCYLNSESDIKTCADYIEGLFVKVALPFFEKYNDLKTMDEAINLKNGTSIFSGPKYRGNLGIILAKLVQNPDYDFFKRNTWNIIKLLAADFTYRNLKDSLKY